MDKEAKIYVLPLPCNSIGLEGTIYPALLNGQGYCVLVDCGYAGMLPTLAAAMACYGIKLDELTHLLLTHHDHDHMGGAAELLEAYPSIRVLASEIEKSHIDGSQKSFRL